MAVQDRLGAGGNLANRLGRAGVKSRDVRNKLIQKKRANIKDARERLGEITKSKGDARQIIKKKGQGKIVTGAKGPAQKKTSVANVKLDYNKLYDNLSPALRKKIFGGAAQAKLGGQAETSMKNGALVRTVKSGTGSRIKPRPAPLMKKPAQPVIKKTVPNIRSDRDRARAKIKMVEERRAMRKTPVWDTNREIEDRRILEERRRLVEERQQMLEEQRLIERRRMETRRLEQQLRMEQYEIERRARARPAYLDTPPLFAVDEWDSRTLPTAREHFARRAFEFAPPPRKTALSNEMAKRLDEERKPAVQSTGYKIKVSNLHRAVTIEDVEELFGNIGPLSSVKMVQQGTAEVVFLNKDDAYKSIEEYHFRLLDGQAMNVSVVSDSAAGKAKRKTISLPDGSASEFKPTSKRMVREVESKPATKSVLKSASGSKKYITTTKTLAEVARAAQERRRAYSPPTPRPKFTSYGPFR